MADKTVQIGSRLFKLPFADLIPMDPRDRAALKESIREAGEVHMRLVCWQQQHDPNKDTVIDGATRAEIAAELGLTYVPIELHSFGTKGEARQECERLNYARRHLTREQLETKRDARVERVAAARAEGQSTRAIAETEGVSQTQVQRDLQEEANTGQDRVDKISTEPPGSVETVQPQVQAGSDVPQNSGSVQANTVTGRDGRVRPAKKPKKCDRCTRLNISNPDCGACRSIREAPARAKAEKAAAKQRKKDEAAGKKAQREAERARWKQARDTARQTKREEQDAAAEEKAELKAERERRKTEQQAEKDRKGAEQKAKEEAKRTPAADETPQDALQRVNGLIESFCRGLMKYVNDELPEDHWISDMNRREGVSRKCKDACEMLRSCKCSTVCPVCKGAKKDKDGTKCRPCHATGRLPKLNLDQVL